jgi:hypothetical protein
MDFTLFASDIYDFIIRDVPMSKAMGGIYPADQLPNPFEEGKFYIINSDPANLPGEHWICVYFPKGKDKNPEFFDSLGRNASFYLYDILHFTRKNYIYNSLRLQGPNLNTCALYCLYFMYHRVRNKSYKDIMEMFTTNEQYNDSVVINFYINKCI